MDSVEEITSQLRRRGLVQRTMANDAEAVEWRDRAREAARSLGRPVRTTQGGLVVVAVLKDWPANELERQLDDLRVANAIKRMRIPITLDVPAASATK